MDVMKMPADLPDVTLNANAELVLKKRYQRKGLDGTPIESPKEMFWRVAASIASMEKNYSSSPRKPGDLARAFYAMMTEYDFLPNSPTLMNAGTELGQLAACFVLPVGDSMDEIFDAVKHAALIHKSGGGTGFSLPVCVPRTVGSDPRAGLLPVPSPF